MLFLPTQHDYQRGDMGFMWRRQGVTRRPRRDYELGDIAAAGVNRPKIAGAGMERPVTGLPTPGLVLPDTPGTSRSVAPTTPGLGAIAGASLEHDLDQLFDRSDFRGIRDLPGITREAFNAGLERRQQRTAAALEQQERAGTGDSPAADTPESAQTDTPEGLADAIGGNLGGIGTAVTVGKAAMGLLGVPFGFPATVIGKHGLATAIGEAAANAAANEDPDATPGQNAAVDLGHVNAEVHPDDVNVTNAQGKITTTRNFGVRGAPDDDAGTAAANAAAANAAANAAAAEGNTGVGPAGPNSGAPASAGPAAANAAANAAAEDDAGGDGGGGAGGCFLASWTLNKLPKEQAATGRKFFADFYRMFMASDPEKAKRMLGVYQAVAKKILAKVNAADPKVQAQVQQYLYTTLVKPTGDFLEREELEGAVKNLAKVVLTLAKKFGVPRPSGPRLAAGQSFGLGEIAGAQEAR